MYLFLYNLGPHLSDIWKINSLVLAVLLPCHQIGLVSFWNFKIIKITKIVYVFKLTECQDTYY